MSSKTYMRAWHKKHPEAQPAYDARRYAEPKMKILILKRSKSYYKRNRAKILKRHRLWFKLHPKETREYTREYMRKLRRNTIRNLGGKCSCCGEKTYEFLEVHHVRGQGTSERKKFGPTLIALKIRKEGFPKKKYRILCANCHRAISSWGFCPHQRAGKEV